MARTPSVTVLEQCRVTPKTGGATVQLSLPLTFYDTMWWNYFPVQHLFLYEFPCSKTHFVDTIVPKIKDSLALALKHYLPLAGNLIYPSDSGKLEFRYAAGDSVSLTFAEITEDFNYLVKKSPRNTNRFYPLVPQFPSVSMASGMKKVPLFAIQVTLFPNTGICIGLNTRHTIGDGRAITGFIKAWASINKHGGDVQLLASGTLPVFDRLFIEDPFDLDTEIFNRLKVRRPEERSPATMLPTRNVRATYVMSPNDIQNLKNFVFRNRPNHVHATSFVITCAYIWICWLKSLDAIREKVGENQTEKFTFLLDCRDRFDPPIPDTYFGNCLVLCFATSTHGKLTGPEGLLIATELIGEAIRKRLDDKMGILNGSWLAESQPPRSGEWQLSVAGSSKYDVYSVDFGWGKPEKHESLDIDVTGGMSLCTSKKFDGGLEVGLSMSKNRMDAFATIFNDNLRTITLSSKI